MVVEFFTELFYKGFIFCNRLVIKSKIKTLLPKRFQEVITTTRCYDPLDNPYAPGTWDVEYVRTENGKTKARFIQLSQKEQQEREAQKYNNYTFNIHLESPEELERLQKPLRPNK